MSSILWLLRLPIVYSSVVSVVLLDRVGIAKSVITLLSGCQRVRFLGRPRLVEVWAGAHRHSGFHSAFLRTLLLRPHLDISTPLLFFYEEIVSNQCTALLGTP